jgi:hypothetical protein
LPNIQIAGDADHGRRRLANLRAAAAPASVAAFTAATSTGNPVTLLPIFPNRYRDVRGFERGIARFHELAKTLAFNHSNCLLCLIC